MFATSYSFGVLKSNRRLFQDGLPKQELVCCSHSVDGLTKNVATTACTHCTMKHWTSYRHIKPMEAAIHIQTDSEGNPP